MLKKLIQFVVIATAFLTFTLCWADWPGDIGPTEEKSYYIKIDRMSR